MSSAVRKIATHEQRTAVIAEATTWDVFPTLWPSLLDTVWAALSPDPPIGLQG
jgi:hypothetical protein